MAFLSNQDRKPFTPASYEGREGAPVYLMGPLGFRERGAFKRDLTAEGIRYPTDKDIADMVVKLIREAAPDNAEELLAVVDGFRMLQEEPRLEPLPEDASDEVKKERDEEIARRVAIAVPFDDLVDTLRTSPRLSGLFAMRVAYHEMVGPLAAARALRGWENVPVPFRKVNGVVPGELLNALPPGDLEAIGMEAIASLAVSAAQKGN